MRHLVFLAGREGNKVKYLSMSAKRRRWSGRLGLRGKLVDYLSASAGDELASGWMRLAISL
jgi:hypothetical protein